MFLWFFSSCVPALEKLKFVPLRNFSLVLLQECPSVSENLGFVPLVLVQVCLSTWENLGFVPLRNFSLMLLQECPHT